MNYDFSKFSAPVFYLTPDLPRAIGLEKLLPNYHIVCLDESPLVDILVSCGIKVFCLERTLGKSNFLVRNTGVILSHPEVQKYIATQSEEKQPNVMFFKPSALIDKLCERLGYRKIGNDAQLNNRFEDKISFYRMCQELGLPVVPGVIGKMADLSFENLSSDLGDKMVIQFGHGWAGNTTFFVKKPEEFEKMGSAYPTRMARVSRYIKGRTLLNNACVTSSGILVSPPAIQITAPEGFTAHPGGTCGRQWPSTLAPEIEAKITRYTVTVGRKMKEAGYKGYFGLDFLVEDKTSQVYLSENNARLTASVPLYTKMEILSNQLPLLFYHLLEFLDCSAAKPEYNLTHKKLVGAELTLRNIKSKKVTVSDAFEPGVYAIKEEGLIKIKAGYSIEDLEAKKQFVLLAAGRGREVSSESELARMDVLEEVVDPDGEVYDWARKVLFTLKERLVLKE